MARNGKGRPKRKSALTRILEYSLQQRIEREAAESAAAPANVWDAPSGNVWPTSDEDGGGPAASDGAWKGASNHVWEPAVMLTIEELQKLGWVDQEAELPPSPPASEIDEAAKKSVDQLDRELSGLDRQIEDARAKLEDWNLVQALERQRTKVTQSIVKKDPSRDFSDDKTVFAAHKYHKNYHKFSAAAAKGENVPDSELVMTIPFHPKYPDTFFEGAVKQGSFLCKALRDLAIASMILSELTYEDKKSLAIASKETFYQAGSILEVWDTNRFDFLGKDVGIIRVGVTPDGRPVEMKASWSDIMKVKYRTALERRMRNYSRISERFPRSNALKYRVPRSTVHDPMMVDAPRRAAREVEDQEVEPVGHRGHLNVMLTAVRFEATAETRNKSPRLKFSDGLEGMMRSLEVVARHGEAIRSLDISGQHMLAWQHVDLILAGTPNLRQLTIRDCHLLNVTETKNLMEVVQLRRPGITLDFHPFYHFGPGYEGGRPADGQRCGSYGLTFEDSGANTNAAVAVLIDLVLRWEKEFGVEMLRPGQGFRRFLDRVPVPVGFAAKILASHAELEGSRGRADFTEAEMRHQRRVFEAVFGAPAPARPAASDFKACTRCGTRVWRAGMMHTGLRCSWCCLEAFAQIEPHRYRHEKLDMADGMLPWTTYLKPLKALSEVFDRAPPPLPPPSDSDSNSNSDSDREPVRLPLGSDPAADGWAWNAATPVERRIHEAHVAALELEWRRHRDMLREQRPGVARFEATDEFLDQMRCAGWSDRGPGDHEMFPVQQPNIFDNRNTCGAFISVGPAACGVRRPTEAEACIGHYFPASCMDEMRRLMAMDPVQRKKEQSSIW